jgi:hypothetical protein
VRKLSIRKFTAILLILALVFTLSSVVAAAPSLKLKVQTVSFKMVFDGQTLVLPEGQYVFAVKGSTYVPLRFVSYALQKSVIWDGKTATVKVAAPTVQEAVSLKEYLMNATGQAGDSSARGGATIEIAPAAVKFVFDGKSKALPQGQSGYMLNGTLYVPVRFMSESIGTAIKWDAASKQISAESAAFRAQQSGTAGNGTVGSGQQVSDQTAGATNGGTTGGTAGGTGAVSGGAGGGASAKPTYESITSNAESRLKNLQSACQADLTAIAVNYISTDDKSLKAQYKQQGAAKLNACTAQFETIISETQKQLVDNGYSTDIIAKYREEFDKQVEAGKAIMAAMM